MTTRETFWESGRCGCGAFPDRPYDACPCTDDSEGVYRELHPDFYGEPAPFVPFRTRAGWLIRVKAPRLLSRLAALVGGLVIGTSLVILAVLIARALYYGWLVA